MFDLSGKTALVTGASGTIGGAIARALAQQGADVALHYGKNEDAAQTLADELTALGRRALTFGAEAREASALETLWREAEAALGAIDILVNNAGLLKNAPLGMTSEAAWDEVVDANLKSAFVLSKCAAKSWSRQRRAGRIVNISSRAGQMGDVLRAPYCAAKAGLDGLTRATARELARLGATCNAVAPGFVESQMTQGDEARREAQLKLVPLNRLAQPSEVAALVVFLASHEAAYLTGQIIGLDGGLLIAG